MVRGDKLSFKEQRELAGLPERISALETEEASLQARLADPEVYQNAPATVADLAARLDVVSKEMASAMLRWEELESRSDT